MERPYRVAISGAISARIRELFLIARSQGRHKAYRAAVAKGLAKLEADPLGFGEPSFNFKQMRLVNYVGVQTPLVIEYCVDEHRKIVYVKLLNLQDPPPA